MKALLGLMVLFLIPVPALSQEAPTGAETEVESRLYQGAYLAPMFSYILTDKDSGFDDGMGATLAAGYRQGWWAVEASALGDSWKGGKSGMDVVGGTINGLLFFGAQSNLFALIGVGGLDIDKSPVVGKEYSLTTAEAGLGYIFPLSFGRYDWGIRADARYRYGKREKLVEPGGDYDIPNNFQDTVFNIGLQLPLGLRPEPPPQAAPVAVVAPAAICNDTQDNDGDGLIDYPGDPGCSSADDSDETDPPRCSNGKDDDGDGLVDFPADKGCTAADDNDETDPCKSPAPGERVSLKGCGLGDTIVLRGVNFEFDKANLTVNAKTLLDNVAEELTAYPDIKVEVGGHTDAKGSDEYNQKLSERRAASVVKYLKSKGVAADRMTSVGYGETKPVADNETDEGRELNRRVELKITAG
ncbi:MAG TPA: OmpA family protein, partial [Vicinamibacterales bacterium]|nr:OmpA family protein [Vicinamibacterales bacterium]